MERELAGIRPHVQLMRVLLEDVIDGSAAPGGRLPRVPDLARQFGVSAGLVRAAIRGLEERGIVTVRQGHGTIIRPAVDWNVLDEDILAAVLRSSAAVDVLAEFIESRQILEVQAAGIAAERATDGHLLALTNALVRMNAAAERSQRSAAAEDLWHEADVEFHENIIAATGNRVLARMVLPIHRALITARRPLAHPELRMASSLDEHKAILTAIANRQPDEARAAMQRHLTTVERHLRAYLAGAHAEAADPSTDSGSS